MSTLNQEQYADAHWLLSDLCAVAGDEDAVLDVIGRYAQEVGPAQARLDCSAALFLMFAEWMRRPAPLDGPVLVTSPQEADAA